MLNTQDLIVICITIILILMINRRRPRKFFNYLSINDYNDDDEVNSNATTTC